MEKSNISIDCWDIFKLLFLNNVQNLFQAGQMISVAWKSLSVSLFYAKLFMKSEF